MASRKEGWLEKDILGRRDARGKGLETGEQTAFLEEGGLAGLECKRGRREVGWVVERAC